MLRPAALLRMLTELVFILLGVLLICLAAYARLLWNRGSPVWVGLGLFLVYWVLRAWLRLRGAAVMLLIAPAPGSFSCGGQCSRSLDS